MIMDNNPLVEQVVKKKKDVKYYLNVFLIVFVAVAIPATLFILAFITSHPYLVYLSLFIALFCIYGMWYFITSLRVDYEYGFLPTVLRIDRIVNKRKRKPVLKVNVKTFEDFFPYSDQEMGKLKLTKVYRAAAQEFSEENYVAVFRHEARGKCALIFSPNEELIEAMKPHFDNELRKKMFREKRL